MCMIPAWFETEKTLGSGELEPKRSIQADLQSPPYGRLGSIGVILRQGGVLEEGFFTLKILTELLDASQVAMVANRTDACNPWAIRNPSDEAWDLYRMVRFGSCAVGDIRELIAVPKHVREALLAYAERYREDNERIHCILQFRERVAFEFERLVESGGSPSESGHASYNLPICTEIAG